MNQTAVAVLTLVLAALAVVVPVAIAWLTRKRVRLRIEWASPYDAQPDAVEGAVPGVWCRIYNDGDVTVHKLEVWLSNQKPYGGYPLQLYTWREQLAPGPDPWEVPVPRHPWYWDQGHHARHLYAHPDGLELPEQITVTVGYKRFPSRKIQHTICSTSPHPYD